jgi:hypothetical protein
MFKAVMKYKSKIQKIEMICVETANKKKVQIFRLQIDKGIGRFKNKNFNYKS